MQLDQLQQGLQNTFFTDGHLLVFWYETRGHFADVIDELSLDGVVKVSYGNFGDLLVEIKAVTGEKAW